MTITSPPPCTTTPAKSTTTPILRDLEACRRDYERLVETQQYVDFQNALLAPNADALVSDLLLLRTRSPPAPPLQVSSDGGAAARQPKNKSKLAVVTGVGLNSVAFYVAQELALQCDGMHVILLGKSRTGLEWCRKYLQQEAAERRRNNTETATTTTTTVGEAAPTVYTCQYRPSSLQCVRAAAQRCHSIAQQEPYGGQIHLLIHAATVGCSEARLTEDGIEYNAGCNWIAPHYFTRLLLPRLLQAAAAAAATESSSSSSSSSWCPQPQPQQPQQLMQQQPRIVTTSSVGHALGRKFNPSRFAACPQEGGAPEGYLHWNPQTNALHESESTMAAQQQQQQQQRSIIHRLWEMSASLFASASTTTNTTAPAAAASVDWQRVGTQVGRSKMAVLADSVHLAQLICRQQEQQQQHGGSSSNSNSNNNNLTVVCHHPGVVARGKNNNNNNNTGNNNKANDSANNCHDDHNDSQQQHSNLHRFSPSQAAAVALRAALDPQFNNTAAAAANDKNGSYPSSSSGDGDGNSSNNSSINSSNFYYLHCDGQPWHPFYPSARDKATGDPLSWPDYCAAVYQAAETVLERLGFGEEDDVLD